MPIAVSSEQDRWRAEADSNPNRFFGHRLPALMDGVRETVAAFVGTQPVRCALVPNTTTAMSVVLASTNLRRGEEVLVTDDTYVAVRAAVELAARRCGARVVTAALGPEIDADMYGDAVLAHVTSRTRLAFIDHITSPTAMVVDVRRLVAALRERNVTVAVDGAHAPGAIPLVVDEIDADFYAGNFHKWCCAPRGSGFLAVADRRLSSVVPGVVGARFWEGFPSGFEWLGTNDYSAALSVPAALAFLEKQGFARMWARNRELVAAGAARAAASLGEPFTYCETSPMATVSLPEGVAATIPDAERFRDALEDQGVEVAVVRGRNRAFVRLSAHLYNSSADFDRAATALQAVIAR